MLQIKFVSTSCEIALRWMPDITFGDNITLVQIMAWYHPLSESLLTQIYVVIFMAPLGHNELMCYKILWDLTGSFEFCNSHCLDWFHNQGSTLSFVRPSRTGKNFEKLLLGQVNYYDTCPTGQVNNQEDNNKYNSADRCHFMQDRWLFNLTCPMGQVTLKVKIEPW